LYHKNPVKVRDSAWIKWTKYSNSSTFKRQILSKLDTDALIHYENELCTLLPKGIIYVEKHIPMTFLVWYSQPKERKHCGGMKQLASLKREKHLAQSSDG
jgi:hypothetical protein